jgi:heme/copper-type cytochrome/quinol oxidase subunit 2
MYRQVPLIRLRRITPSSPANHALHLVFVFVVVLVFVFIYALVFGLLCPCLCLPYVSTRPLIRLRRITPSSPANHALHLVFVFVFVFVFVYALVFGLLCLCLCLPYVSTSASYQAPANHA